MARISFDEGGGGDFFGGFQAGDQADKPQPDFTLNPGTVFDRQTSPYGGGAQSPDLPRTTYPDPTPAPAPTYTPPPPRTTYPTNPTPPTSGGGSGSNNGGLPAGWISMRDAVANIYRSALGRDPENWGVVDAHIQGRQGNLAQIQQDIYNSAEAQAYGALRSAQGASPASSGLPSSGRTSDRTALAAQVAKWAAMPGADPSLGRDPEYWIRRITETGGLGSDNLDYWQKAAVGQTAFFNNPGREASSGPSLGSTYAGMPGGNPGSYDDPSSALYLNEVLKRLDALHQPVHDPMMELLTSLTTKRVNDLNAPPYSSADEAALITRLRDPLTQARDASLQRNQERIGARGMLPTSGLLDELNKGTEQTYERNLASGTNELAVQGIAERQRRQDEALNLLNSLVGVNRQNRSEQEARQREILQTAEIFPNFDERRLSELLQASGEGASSPGSVVSGLSSLGSLGLNASRLGFDQSQQQADALGQFLAMILGTRR